MRLKLCVVMALACSGLASGQPVTSTIPDIHAQLSTQEAALKLVRRETVAVLAQRDQLDRSVALREEEARSLQARFPAIRLSRNPTSAELISALRSEEQRMLSEHGDTLWAAEVALREQQCATLQKAERAAADAKSNPSWPQLSLEERTAVRTLMAHVRRQAFAFGDPCVPQTRSPQPTSMLDEQ